MSDPTFEELRAMPWPTSAGDRPDPTPSQLWRVVWGDAAAIVAVTAAERSRVNVVPASDPHAGDQHTITVETDSGLRVSLWTALNYSLPNFVLDYRLGDVQLPAHLPSPSPTWGPITSPLDDRSLEAADLRDALGALEAARWAPTQSETVNLMAAAADTGITASKVARELGVLPGAARRILQGTEQPSAEQAAILTELIGTAAARALLPEDLVDELDRPAARPQLMAYATSDFDGDEVAARLAVADRALVLAARQRATRTAIDWHARVEAAFERIRAR